MLPLRGLHRSSTKSSPLFPTLEALLFLILKFPLHWLPLEASVNMVNEFDGHTWNKRCTDVASFLDVFLQTADPYKYDPSPTPCSHDFFGGWDVYTAVKKKKGGGRNSFWDSNKTKQNKTKNKTKQRIQPKQITPILLWFSTFSGFKKSVQRVFVHRVDSDWRDRWGSAKFCCGPRNNIQMI